MLDPFLLLLVMYILTFSTSVAMQVANTAPITLGQCKYRHVRKEYRDMSIAEWNAFRDSLIRLQSLKSPDGAANHSEWDWWSKIHIDNTMPAHNNPLFFPWHRAYVLAFERRLQEINASVVIPYWDWTFDWQRPIESPIFGADFGFNITPNVPDCRFPRAFFKNHCLLRQYNPANFTAYYSPSDVAKIISKQSTYDAFRELIEIVPHGIVHTSLGGKDGDMALMNSPNDPIFWLHHSMIDYIWWIWQRAHPDQANDYKGDPNSIIQPYQVTIKDMFNVNDLCYTYSPFSNNAQLATVYTQGNIASARKMGAKARKSAITRFWTVTNEWLAMNRLTKEEFQGVIEKFEKIAST